MTPIRQFISGAAATRITGCLAVFCLSLTGLFFISGLAEAVDDRWEPNSYQPPHLLAFILCFAPLGTGTALLNSASLACLYWLLTKRQPSPSYHLIWHVLALGGASCIWGMGVFVYAEMVYLNGNRPVTNAQIAANMALTGLLLTSVVLTHRRGR